jgi:hypothetical protein
MRRVTPWVVSALAIIVLAGPSRADSTSDVQKFGAPVTQKKATDIAKLAKAPHKFKGKTVRLEGMVSDVCQGRGCWVKVTSAKGATFLAKSLDESVLVPKDCKGRKVVVQGVVTTLPAKQEEGHGEASHECPAPEYVISMLGVELSDK